MQAQEAGKRDAQRQREQQEEVEGLRAELGKTTLALEEKTVLIANMSADQHELCAARQPAYVRARQTSEVDCDAEIHRVLAVNRGDYDVGAGEQDVRPVAAVAFILIAMLAVAVVSLVVVPDPERQTWVFRWNRISFSVYAYFRSTSGSPDVIRWEYIVAGACGWLVMIVVGWLCGDDADRLFLTRAECLWYQTNDILPDGCDCEPAEAGEVVYCGTDKCLVYTGRTIRLSVPRVEVVEGKRLETYRDARPAFDIGDIDELGGVVELVQMYDHVRGTVTHRYVARAASLYARRELCLREKVVQEEQVSRLLVDKMRTTNIPAVVQDGVLVASRWAILGSFLLSGFASAPALID